MGSQRLRPRQDSSGTAPSPSVQGDPSQTPTSDNSVPAAPTEDPNPTTDPPPSDTSVPGSDTTPPPGAGSSDPGSSQNSTPTPTNPSNTGQSPTNGGSNGGQNTRSPNPDPTGGNPNNDGDAGLITTNGQTLSIAGGVTVAVSQVITEFNGHVTTVTVPIATLSPTTGLTASQRDGIIAGSVLGTFAIGAVVIGFLLYRRRRRIRQQEKLESEIAKPRRLVHSDGPLDLTAGSSYPYVTTAWGSEPHMTQYDITDSRFPFAMVGAGARDSSPRLSRARTSVSGSIFQEEGIWPPPGDEYWPGGGNLSGGGPAPPSRTSLDTQGLADAPFGHAGDRSSLPPSSSASPARPFGSYDSTAPLHPPSPLPILTSMSPHGFRPSSPTSIVSSPVSYASGSRLVPSAAAAAKAREATAESSRSRYRTSAFGPASGPHSAYSESEYNGPAPGGVGVGGGGLGGGSMTPSQQLDPAESSPGAAHAAPFTAAAAAADDLGSAASRAPGAPGSSGTNGGVGGDRGFGEAINARLNPIGLGGGPSPSPTPLENEIPPLYSMIRRDTDISLEGGTTPGRNT